MAKHNKLTVKGQVTVPKDVRDALGLRPGSRVSFEKNGAGDFVLRKVEPDAIAYKEQYQAALRAIDEARRKYPMDTFGMTTDEYMAMVREPVPLPEDR